MANRRPPIKMKVPVRTLLDNARKYRDVLVAEGEEATAKYAVELAAYRGRVSAKLHEAAIHADATDDLDVFEWVEEYAKGTYRQTGVTIQVGERPEKPNVVDRADVDRDIAILTATSETELTLTVEDDFARYLRSN